MVLNNLHPLASRHRSINVHIPLLLFVSHSSSPSSINSLAFPHCTNVLTLTNQSTTMRSSYLTLLALSAAAVSANPFAHPDVTSAPRVPTSVVHISTDSTLTTPVASPTRDDNPVHRSHSGDGTISSGSVTQTVIRTETPSDHHHTGTATDDKHKHKTTSVAVKHTSQTTLSAASATQAKSSSKSSSSSSGAAANSVPFVGALLLMVLGF